ncbi:MAG: DUF58 domain-containing protein [Pseudomonadota bacterium]
MIPGRGLLLLAGTLLAAGLVGALLPALAPLWPWMAAGAAFIGIVDAALVWRLTPPRCERQVPGSLSLATWASVGIELSNDSESQTIVAQVYDHHPATVIARGLPQNVRIAPGRFALLSYEVRPVERGPMSFERCECRLRSPLRLWWRRVRVGEATPVRTYPNYSAISKLLAYEVDNRIQAAGLRLSRRRGEGIEFHQLRDYRDGDGISSIDWKATARVSRLITREYQEERDQQVVFLLDAGRRMLAQDDELGHFDHALNGMLLMSFVALRQGDSVGVMTIADKRTWLPPKKGIGTINSLLNHVYDVQPKPIDVDYIGAATDIATRQRRRSLIVILTNAREEDSHDLRTATSLLRRRHLVIVASLREQILDQALEQPVNEFNEALRYAATSRYLGLRRESQNILRSQGVYVEDCLCHELPAAITNRYLAIKRAGAL